MSLARLGFVELVRSAAAAGFDAVSLWDHTYRRALEREGLALADLGRVLDDHGVACTHVEALFEWLSPPLPGTFMISVTHDQAELMDVAEAVGATGIVLAHFGEPAPVEVAIGAFASACDRAAERGLSLALEYPAWATIGTFSQARAIVEGADRPNGGLLIDTWHHVRCGAELADIDEVAPERILGIQLADGSTAQVGTLQEDAANRRPPGAGEFELARFVATWWDRGVRCPVGPEVLDAELNAQGAGPAARQLMAATRTVVPPTVGNADAPLQ